MWALAVLAAVYVAIGVWLYVFQENYVYFPDTNNFQQCVAFAKAEKISFGSARGYLTVRSPEKLIVYYHGDGGSACDYGQMDAFFAKQGYSTFFVEYSGYAETGTKPSMKGILQNVIDTIAFLKTKDFTTVVVVGESLGVGPTAYHALHGEVANLVLITPYTTLADVAAYLYPFYYGTRALLRDNFMPDVWLASYIGPVSLFVAEQDTRIPPALGQKLFEDIPSPLKHLYVVKDATHEGIFEKDEFYTLFGLLLK